MPFLTHSCTAEEEMVAPSVATVTRSTSKKGRSKIVSPFRFTTRRSLFFPTDTPKPSTNTSPKTLYRTHSFAVTGRLSRTGRTR